MLGGVGTVSFKLHQITNILIDERNSIRTLYTFQRRSGQGTTIPMWLTTPGPIYIRNFNRTSTKNLLVHEVELLHVNPT